MVVRVRFWMLRLLLLLLLLAVVVGLGFEEIVEASDSWSAWFNVGIAISGSLGGEDAIGLLSALSSELSGSSMMLSLSPILLKSSMLGDQSC